MHHSAQPLYNPKAQLRQNVPTPKSKRSAIQGQRLTWSPFREPADHPSLRDEKQSVFFLLHRTAPNRLQGDRCPPWHSHGTHAHVDARIELHGKGDVRQVDAELVAAAHLEGFLRELH